MKNRKGFTLIELLAVIVILAILALIAIPIIISIISDSRENSHKRSIETFGRSIENVIATWQSKNDGEPPKYISDYEVKTSGEKVLCDNEIKGLYSDDGIELTNCYVVDSKGKQKSKEKYNLKNGKVSKVGKGSDSSYHIGDRIKVANEYYYVIADSDLNQDYVTALKSNPLTVDEVNANKIGSDNVNHINRYTYSNVGEAYNYNGYGVIAYYSSPKCGYPIPGKTDYFWEECESEGATNYNNSDIKYVVDKWANTTFRNNELKEVTLTGYGTYKSRLTTKEEILSIGWPSCSEWQIIHDGYCMKEKNTPSWIYNSNYWYWTMSKWNSSSDSVHDVYSNGSLFFAFVTNAQGSIRPVINVYKSAIQN